MEDRRAGVTAGEVIEIELTGTDDRRSHGDEPDDSRPPERRWLIPGLTGAAALAVALIVALVASSDDSDTAADPTSPPSIAADTTTPPTVTPLDAIDPVGSNAPRTPPAALVPPDYPPAAERATDDESFDLVIAVAGLVQDRPRRTITDYLGGSGAVSRFTIETGRDTSKDRFVLVTRRNDVAQSFVVDLAGGTTYQSINSQDTSWFAMSNDDMEAGLDGGVREVVLDPFVLGPIDPAWLDTQTVVAVGWVILPDGGTVALEYVLTVDPAVAAERFRNQAVPNSPPDVPVELHLYVTEANELVLVEGSVHDGGEWTLVSHRVEPLSPEDAVVELPDPDLVSGGVPTEAPD